MAQEHSNEAVTAGSSACTLACTAVTPVPPPELVGCGEAILLPDPTASDAATAPGEPAGLHTSSVVVLP
eukprot:scaffold85731_cov31-Tisochrysis_lutea.AAC.3